MKRILLQTVAAYILLSGYSVIAYSATGDTTSINVTINVTGRTCQFDKASDTVQLTPVRVEDFINSSRIIAIKDVPVSITCSNNVDAVKINVKGESAYFHNDNSPSGVHPYLFQNTGTAKNIGLAFMDKDGKQLSSVNAGEHITVPLENGKASYAFKAGYGALVSEQAGLYYISAGSFQSSVNLTFNYD